MRLPDAADGRYTNAVLTDAGLAAVVASAPGHVAAVRSLVFDALTPAQLSGRCIRTSPFLLDNLRDVVQ